MIRVGLTGATDSWAEAAEQCHSLGLEPVHLPCISVVPAPAAVIDRFRQEAQLADWIVLTSARAVRMVWPEGAMPPRRVAAVGVVTARAAQAAGGRVEVTGDQGGEDLVARLGSRLEGAVVAYPHAGVTAFDLTGAMTGSGARVVHEAVYTTSPISPPGDPVDAVVFGSPSAVRGWCSARGLDGLTVAVTGPTTAGAVRAAGHPEPLIPKVSGFTEALAALAAAMIVVNQKGQS